MPLIGSLRGLLWGALALYSLHLAWNAIWYSALAWLNTPGAWSPNPVFLPLYMTVAYLAMVLLAYRRLVLARRGTHVPALLEPLSQRRPSLIG